MTTSTRKSAKELVSQLLSTKCQKCSKRIIESDRHVIGIYQAWYKVKSPFSSQVSCRSCSAKTCMGCSGKLTGNQTGAKGIIEKIPFSSCCSQGRAFLIWVWLCGFDERFCAAKQHESAQASRTRQRRGGSGVGYEDDTGPGFYNIDDFDFDFYPFGGGGRGAVTEDAAAQKRKAQAETVEQRTDRMATTAMSGLIELLPSKDQASKNPQSTFDANPPEAITSFLLNSKILDKAGELLRNDSLEDVVKRKDIYLTLITFLRLLGSHSSLAKDTIFSERKIRSSAANLLTDAFPRNSSTAKTKVETTTALIDYLRNLDVQCKTMLQVSKHNSREFRDSEGQTMLSICRKISDLSGYLKTKSGTKADVKVKESSSIGHGIIEVDDQQIFSTFYYARHASRPTHSPPGRMKRLITEITTLKTGLPPGIFVKYASSRPDCMKIVIVGPADTPYENGLFEFDLWCPWTYPYDPPKMWFKGTDGGRLVINPNLHEDGKVCLSLLGTWEGEPWRPAQSTLLQVFISVQAMIFCANPMANVPGMTSYDIQELERRGANAGIRHATVRVAMIRWLQNPPPLWKDVVSSHFRKNGKRILEVVGKWEERAQPRGRPDPLRTGAMGNSLDHTRSGMADARRKLRDELVRAGYISSTVSAPAPAPLRYGGGHQSHGYRY